MTFFIRTPTGTDRYSLTSDLTILAGDVSSHLDNLQTSINLAVKENSAPNFSTITTDSPPIFPGITIVGTRPNSSVVNNADGFGFKSNALKFTTSDSITWQSNGPIEVPNSGTGFQAVNANGLNSAVTTLTNRIAALEATVAALTSNVYSKEAVDTAMNNLGNRVTSVETALANKADWWKAGLPNSNSTWVASANDANYASYAGSAGSAGTAGTAGNASRHGGMLWTMGIHNIGDVPASGGDMSNVPNRDAWIYHNLGVPPTAAFLTPIADDGQHSVVASIIGMDQTYLHVNYRNLNVNDAEYCSLSWMVIGY